MSLIRPGTLEEVLQRARHGEEFRYLFVGFLDEFYRDTDTASRRSRILTDPGYLNDERQDAYIGAVAEHLCERWNLGPAPEWSNDSRRMLKWPWFIGEERMKAFLLVESPIAFRRRFIFTEIEPLRRASMPRDRQWWVYEELRTGLRPTDETDIAQSSPSFP